ncbi:MAG: hypothetical protein QNJ15_10305, partial [Erythrobacter sp.]|nr:hypothetical protein [Erythrobacter sp.]
MTNKLSAFANIVSAEKQSDEWLDLAGYEHRPVTSAMLRGGRMTKQHGVVASYSPELGVSVAVDGAAGGETSLIGRALAALRWGAAPAAIAASGLVGASSALAQDACVETTPGSGVFVCEDNGAPATTTQDLFGFLGSDTTIEDGFEVDTTGVGGNGLEARSNGGIAIRQASGTSTVTGDVGIDVENFVNDGITVQTGGAVTGTVAQGIRAENNSGPTTSFIIIDSTAGTVTGATSGISVDNAGNGAIEVTTADVVALNGIGIGAGDDLLNPGTSVFVDSSAGSVSGTAGGITASNYGSGSATVITGDVSATSGFGIRLNTRGGMTTIDTSAGSVTATGDGIDVSSRSTAGDLLTITTGSVSGTFGDGIAASGGGDVTVDTSAGSVSGGQHGLLVENFLGTLSIVTGDVTGSSEEAIEVDGAFTTFVGDLSIDTTAGTVSGGRGGVVVFTSGSGSNTVRTADVSATGGVAIDVRTGGSDLTIDTTAGSVIGELGVRAGLSGISGNVEIRTGNVTSTAGTAVAAFSGRDSDIEIDTSAGSLSSQGDGIRVSNSGTGDITVTTGNITSASYGVYVEMGGVFDPSGGDISIDTSGGVVDAGSRGIRVRNYGPGTTTLTVNDVSSNYGPAIQARSSQASASITVRGSSGDIVGATDGIYLSTQMAPILVENLDSVTGQNGLGLNLRTIGGSITVNDIGLVAGTFGSVLAQSQGGAITITGIGELDGILNANSYGGNISIQDIGQSGGIGGAYGAGILANARAFGNGSGGNIEIGTTGAIGDIFSVYGFGISATTDGLGTVTIDSSGGTINSAGRGIDVNLASGDGAISITTGDVDARQDGVYVRSNGAGSGAVTIDTSGGSISSTYSRGIYVNSSYSPVSIVTGDITANTYGIQSRNFGADVLVDTSQGTVSGVTTGVGVFHSGTTGAVSVITGATSGTSRYGTAVVATGTGLTIDTSAGSATGGTWGVVGISNGSGATSVTTADATGFTRDGVFVAANSGMGTNVSVDTSAGTVIGQYDGIDSYNGGIGSHTIITADVTGTNFAGIFAQNSALGTNFTVDSSAGSVIGGNDGIDLDQYGSGALTITTADVTGTIGDGIDARSYGTELSIDTSAGTVSGATNGIFVVQRGTGAVTLTVNDVTGYGGYGISATSTAGNAHITVRGSSGDIVGATDGIYTRTLGADITVDNLDSVTGQAGDGLDLGSVGGAVTVSDIGTITGNGGAGIRIDSAGGDISIQGVGTVGGVTGTAGSGIYANASIFGADGHINIGDVDAIGAVSGTDDGIYARTSGAGSITIVASGDVTGGNRGVLAITYDTGAISIDSTGVAVSGGFDNGIQAANINGSGSITVTTGDVSSTYGDGVYVGAYLGDTTIDTTGGAVTAGANGITARNGIGATSMSISTGDITATNFGVYARAQTGDLDVDTTSGDVNADNFALVILSDDGGATSLTAGNVTSTNGTGVFARSRGNSTSLTVDTTAGSIQGQYSGVVARQEGTGTLTVTTADTNATGYSGIFALTYGSDATVDSTAGTTSGGNFGVYALNRGTGSLTITTADAFGTDFDGVYADAAGGTTDLTIDSSAGSVSGGRNGIYARDAGSGILTITTADVAGGSFAGIRARKIAGTDLLIDTTAGSVNGANSGINASLDYATGSVSVATGAVTATAGMGVSVTNSAYGANLLIDTTGGPVVGSLSGVYARNDGSGYTSVITADVTGRTFDGVDVRAQGTDVIVDTAAGTVIGQQSGVSVQHQGTGTVDVTTADVTGTYAVGVAISSIGNGINLDTSAGTVTGGSNGISVTNDGYGPTSITTAAVVGNGSYGILVRSYATAGDVTIDSSAGPVSGNDNGIRATQYGAGGLSITSADATGNYGRGIYAYLGGF